MARIVIKWKYTKVFRFGNNIVAFNEEREGMLFEMIPNIIVMGKR
jgi:hypothetical protein